VIVKVEGFTGTFADLLPVAFVFQGFMSQVLVKGRRKAQCCSLKGKHFACGELASWRSSAKRS
jgi:hypothetical protein